MIRRLLSKLKNRLIPVVSTPSACLTREVVAERYLKGEGIEIGALHKPLKTPGAAKVKYLDRMPEEALRSHYPELKDLPLVPVDIIDNGEALGTLQDASLDFVIANHFLEHCQNPIKALTNMFRVLKEGGVLYLAVPDKRFTFDRHRPETRLEHLIRDFEEGPEWSRTAAFEEYVRCVDGLSGDEARARVERYMRMDYSIHYHVWTEWELLELMTFLRGRLKIEFSLELMLRDSSEIIALLRKRHPSEAGSSKEAASFS